MDHENDHGDIRYGFIYDGVIVDRADPLGLGRVRVRVPGLIEDKSAWAFPVGNPGGGTKKTGLKFVPPMGAEVVIYFRGGDPDQPRYMGGHWGQPDGESEISVDPLTDQTANPEDVITFETANYLVTIDDRPGKDTYRITHKTSGDMIEHDGSKATGPGWTIQASAAVYIKCDGQFIVDALSVVLNGRKVVDGSQNI